MDRKPLALPLYPILIKVWKIKGRPWCGERRKAISFHRASGVSWGSVSWDWFTANTDSLKWCLKEQLGSRRETRNSGQHQKEGWGSKLKTTCSRAPKATEMIYVLDIGKGVLADRGKRQRSPLLWGDPLRRTNEQQYNWERKWRNGIHRPSHKISNFNGSETLTFKK